MKRVLLAAAILATVAACSSRPSSVETNQGAPTRPVTGSENGAADVHTSPVPGESGVSGSTSKQ